MTAQNFVPFRSNHRSLSIALKIGFVYALLITPALALPQYSITDIGFGGEDINNKGQVAGSGSSTATQGKAHAFRYTDGAGEEDLGVLSELVPGIEPKYVPLDSSYGYAINDVGQVVGVSGNYGFRYTDGVGMENLSQLYCNPSNSSLGRSCFGRAMDINRTGQVIGDDFGLDTGQRIVTVRFTDGLPKVNYFAVAAVSDSVSYGLGINDAGQSVGYSADTLDVKHAFRITDGFGMEYLGSLGGSIQSGGEYSWGHSVSKANGINTSGQVTGKSSTTSLTWHGFVYTDGVGMQDLGVLQGDDSSEGFKLNDSGQVVGRSWNTNGGRSHPVLWTQPGCPEDLNLASGVKESGWILSSVASINNKGQIVGNGINPAGESHGYRLTPIAAGVPHCSAATPSPGSAPSPVPEPDSGFIEPKDWKTVHPLQSCTTNVCKTKWVKKRKLLKAKAMMAIKTKKAADKATVRVNQVAPNQRASANANATKKQTLAGRARSQYDRIVIIVQRLHN